MRTSATQLETLSLCARKWWFKYVDKLPEQRKDHFGFGTILHSACERFLLGQELWPSGWDYDAETKKRLLPAEAALVQVLITEAINAGHLERRADSQVEVAFELEATEQVTIVGKIDHLMPVRIEDHKHSKSPRYFKSPKALKENLQMQIYAKWLVESQWRKKGLLPPPVITLVHNQFLKDFDNPLTQQRSAEVTPKEIDDFYRDVVLKLVELQEQTKKVQDPFAIADPEPSACNAFGGCSYMSVCSGAMDRLTYKKRISTIPDPQPMTSMSPNDFLSRRSNAPSAAAPQVNPPAPAVKAEQPEAAKPVEVSLPPWRWAACPMCSKKPTPGWNEKKSPCRICVATTKHSTDAYEWQAMGDGRIVWWKKGEKSPVAEVAVPKATDNGSRAIYTAPDFVDAVKAASTPDEVTQAVAQASQMLGEGSPELTIVTAAAEKRLDDLIDQATPSPTAEVELKPEPEPVVEAAPAPVEAEADAPKRRGRPRKNPAPESAQPIEEVVEAPAAKSEPSKSGLVLVIGADVVSWPGAQVVSAESVLNRIPGYWDTIQGGSYDSQAAFRRRDAVRAAANSADGAFIKELQNLVVVQKFRDPDVSNLMSALMPHASCVICGVLA